MPSPRATQHCYLTLPLWFQLPFLLLCSKLVSLGIWQVYAVSRLIGKDPDAEKHGGQEELRMTGRDGRMALPTQWTWVWANSRRWWRTGKPGVLQSMGSQRVGDDWATEQQNTLWTRPVPPLIFISLATNLFHFLGYSVKPWFISILYHLLVKTFSPDNLRCVLRHVTTLKNVWIVDVKFIFNYGIFLGWLVGMSGQKKFPHDPCTPILQVFPLGLAPESSGFQIWGKMEEERKLSQGLLTHLRMWWNLELLPRKILPTILWNFTDPQFY